MASPPIQRSAAEDQDYTFCHGLFQDKLYALAKEQLEAFVQKYPSSIRRQDALFLLGECSYHQGDFADALTTYARLIGEFPSAALTDDAHFRMGQANLALKRPAEAVGSFKRVIDDFSASPLAGEAAYWLGESYVALGERETAVKYYTLSFEHFPNNPYKDYALYAIGWTRQSGRNYAEAMTSYRMLIDSLPSSSLGSAARIRIAECRFGLEDFSGALAGLLKERSSISAPLEAGQADFLIAESHERLGQHAAALDAYHRFLSSHPDHPLHEDGQYGLGWTLFQAGKLDSASAVFGEVGLRGGKRAAAAMYRKGAADLMRRDTTAAMDAYRRCVDLDAQGEFADNALVDQADLLLLKGDVGGAKTTAERVVQSYPGSDVKADALRIVGDALLRQGEPVLARERLREASAVPGARFDVAVGASFQTAWASFRAGEYEQASIEFGAFIQKYPAHPRSAEARYWQAEAEYRRGSFEKALALYRMISAEANHTRRLDAAYGEGWSLYKLGRYQESAAAFERLVQFAPRGAYAYDARLRQADALFALKEYARAGQTYRSVLRTFPDSASNDYAAYQAAQAAYRGNDLTEAYKQFAELVRTMPQSPLADDAQYAMGWVNFQRKEYTEAIREFQKVTRNFPTSDAAPRAFYSLGDSYYNLQQYAAAEASYRELIRRFPDHRLLADGMVGLQYALVAQGKEQEASAVIDQFIRDHEGTSAAIDLRLKKAELLFGQKNFAAAADAYRSYLTAAPDGRDRGQAHYWLGRSLLAMGQGADALRSFEAAAGSEGRFAGLASIEAIDLAMAAGSSAKALEFIMRSEKRFGSDADVLPEVTYRKGQLFLNDGNGPEARRIWGEVIRRWESSRASDRARVGLARLSITAGDLVEARTLAQRVATGRTDEIGAEAQFVVGETWAAAGDWKQAATAYLRVRYVFTAYPLWVNRAMLEAGRAYERGGDKARAKETYRDLLKRQPEASIRAEAEQRIGALN
ncbi:MAG: tetratricopeptide repeat protein [Bacteroidetes bacterium]|nr:tetratricopeptide repeat protein [Bacteroidota bacterium]